MTTIAINLIMEPGDTRWMEALSERLTASQKADLIARLATDLASEYLEAQSSLYDLEERIERGDKPAFRRRRSYDGVSSVATDTAIAELFRNRKRCARCERLISRSGDFGDGLCTPCHDLEATK